MGPLKLTGGGYGLDASWLAFIVFLVAIPLVYRLTRDLDFRYNAPVIIAGGIPVDLDAAARRQHEQASGSAVTPPSTPAALVQIAPAASQAVSASVAASSSASEITNTDSTA